MASLTRNSTQSEIEEQRAKLLARVHLPVVKLMFVGDSGVGKTAIIQRFMGSGSGGSDIGSEASRDAFQLQFLPTYSVDFACKTTNFQGTEVQLRAHCCDTHAHVHHAQRGRKTHYILHTHTHARARARTQRDRETEKRDRERDRERDRDRDRDRYTETERHSHAHARTHTHTDTHTHAHAHTHTIMVV